MSLYRLLTRYQRFVFGFAILMALAGLVAYNNMARQEDPSFPYRVGILKVVFPGASADQIEKLITEPLEEELAQVEEIKQLESISRDNIAVFTIQLKDRIYDTDSAWDRVRRAMDRAQREFPDGVSDIELDDRRMDIPTVVLSIAGDDDPIVLADAAEEIKQHLLTVPGVSRIEVNGAPEKELVIATDETVLHQLGINRQTIVQQLQQRNALIPGGLINNGDRFIRINTQSDVQQLNDLALLPITLPNGQRVPLNALASIRIEPREPLAAQTFHNGERTVSLGVITVRGQTDTIAFGEGLRKKLDEIRPMYVPLEIKEAFFQPTYVKARLDELQNSLLISAAIIAVIVFLALGWRTGLLVALVLPVVALITLAVYNMGGGILHQVAVIGIVISLGILVDNAIVIVESIETQLRNGLARSEAVKQSIIQLAMPLFSSTGTTIAAFIPLLLSKGGTADFTRGIPVMIVLAMITSYVISVFLLPLVAFYWLKPGKQTGVPGSHWIAEKLVLLQQRYSKRALLGVLVLMVVVIAMAPLMKMQFFPSADRNQLVIDLELPMGTPVDYTAELSQRLEQQLLQREGVDSVMRSVGMTGFRFFYNLSSLPDAPNRARLMVNTHEFAYNRKIIDWIEHEVKFQMPEATLVAKPLGQGPPLPAPIVIRLQHPDKDVLTQATYQALQVMYNLEGTRTIRTNMDTGIAELQLNIDDYSSAELGIQRPQITSEIFGQVRGLDAGQYRYSNDPITMRVRSRSGEHTGLDRMPALYLYQDQQPIPIQTMASIDAAVAASEIYHFNGVPTVNLYSELQQGAAFNQILKQFFAKLDEQPLPAGVNVIMGGESEGSDNANKAILKTAPIGIMVMIFFMLLEFNSYRRLLMVLTTIPLAAVGILPGLVLTGSPFGFQSLLGVIALVGIVVNNAIVLLDVVDTEMHQGRSVLDAVQQAIRQRTAPILLTTATTVLGLLPLALSSSTLWPPLAWAVISGLVMSTVLTLIVVPGLCQLLLRQAPPAEFEAATA